MTEPSAPQQFGAHALSAPLEAALSVFVEHGYHGASVRQVAAKAGLSVPGLYHHFASKQKLLVGLMAASMNDLAELTSEAERRAGTRPADRFDAVVSALLRFHMFRRDEAFLGSTEIRSLEPDNRVRYVAQRDEQQRVVDRIVSDGVADGSFSTPHPLDASRAVVTMCVAVAGWYRPDGALTPDALVARYLDIARGAVGAAVG